MLKKIAFCGLLIAACVGGALAQNSPLPRQSPSPSPAQLEPGTRPYTEVAIQTLKKARAAYDDQCNTGTSLDVMNAAYSADGSAWLAADNAVGHEVFDQPRVREAEDNYRSFANAYYSLHDSKKDYEAELKAESAMNKAGATMSDIYNKAREALANALDAPEVLGGPLYSPCPKHQALIDAKKKADAAAKEASSKVAQKTATGTAKPAADCNKGGGLSGPLEGLACQEGKK